MNRTVVSSTCLDDAALPTLQGALDPHVAAPVLIDRLRLPNETRLTSLRVLAHKPGRRCLIEYEFDSARRGTSADRLAVLGKIRVNRFGNSGYRQLRALWEAGFDDRSADAISVPQPLATVPAFCMWLQRKIDGRVVTSLLSDPPMDLAERIAFAVQKLHTTGLSVERRHTMDDELAILQRCLDATAGQHPRAARPIHRLIDSAARVGSALPAHAACPSHRDFYSDQLLVSDRHLYLLDFDLFCAADPGLDVGNFLGHVTEHALRHFGSATALAGFERDLENRFVAHAGEGVRHAVRVYAALTLARHVYLCTRFADRAHLMPALLNLAHERLDAVAAEGGPA